MAELNVQEEYRDDERIKQFGAELDRLRERVEAQLGAEDRAHLKRVARASLGLEVLGRGLIHVSFGPVGLGLGILSLTAGKLINGIEIGHSALHGNFDKLEGAEKYHSKQFRWMVPIDEASWQHTHNIRHHQYTNILGRDPDMRVATVRWNENSPYIEEYHKNQHWQLPFALLYSSFLTNLHCTGLADHLFAKRSLTDLGWTDERTPEALRAALHRTFRKILPLIAREYVFYPMLAGPMFGKVMVANWLSERGRDIYSGLAFLVSHHGDDITHHPEGTKAGSRHRWYAMQVESTSNFDVPFVMAILCGGLEHQIEHHLFPKLPPNRLRQIAPQVRAICERYGVQYRTSSWGHRIKKVFQRAKQLSRRVDKEQPHVAGI